MIEMSADTVELFKALVAFQAECPSPTKTSTNPHFKNRYAPLDVVLETVQPYLTKNGLTVNQFPCGATPGMVGVVTQIGHISGQWMRCAFSVNITKNDPQMAGSGISYARRYAVLAALNLAAEDDDGESATRDKPQAKQSTTERLNAIAASGGERAERPLAGNSSTPKRETSSASAKPSASRGGDPVPVAKVIESVGAQTPGDGAETRLKPQYGGGSFSSGPSDEPLAPGDKPIHYIDKATGEVIKQAEAAGFTVERIMTAPVRPKGDEPTLTFGKYKGKRVLDENIPAGYYRWFQQQSDYPRSPIREWVDYAVQAHAWEKGEETP